MKNDSLKDKVSIVIPIYNMERYLARCLDSILSQSYQNYEVLLIDDGSVDSSEQIANKYLHDIRFHYFYQENLGVSAARNKGVNNAVGQWIAFVDPDDYLDTDYLYSLMSNIKPDTDIISCCAVCDGTGKEIHFFDGDTIFGDEDHSGKVGKKELLLELINVQYGAKTVRETAIGVPWGKIYRKALFDDNNLRFDTRLFRMQDNIFNMYAFNCSRDVVYIDKPLYIYNLDNIKNFGRKYTPRVKQYSTLVSVLRYEFLKKQNLLDDSEIYREFCWEILRNADNMLRKYFLHKDNKKRKKDIIIEMEEEFRKDIFKTVFLNKEVVHSFLREKNWIVKIRIYLLIKRMYRLLFAFDYLVQVIR